MRNPRETSLRRNQSMATTLYHWSPTMQIWRGSKTTMQVWSRVCCVSKQVEGQCKSYSCYPPWSVHMAYSRSLRIFKFAHKNQEYETEKRNSSIMPIDCEQFLREDCTVFPTLIPLSQFRDAALTCKFDAPPLNHLLMTAPSLQVPHHNRTFPEFVTWPSCHTDWHG